ncbi:alpha-defensin 1-like [Phyllostomus hastatus]|uniref:alpha-defensin 1-like n=1 Tax=Phyllostomus hastatus TaxID=9423 RepID=UPI001E681C37|nr:alpha-defensin 1-like [Phyllostomus hastatus]
MRTLTLLTALLLLAFQARAETLQETADQVPAQGQPEVEDQDQPEDEDQDVAVSFTGGERSPQGAAGLQRAAREVCYCRVKCRLTIFSKFSERPSGRCKAYGHRYKLCCK